MPTHKEYRQAVDEARKLNYERQEVHARSNLKRHIVTKLKTTMIGSLDKFEQTFGYLWGHGKDESDLTPDEKHFRQMWFDTRTEVLNNGNNQIRAAESEIDQYSVKFNKFKYDFVIKKPKE